GGGGGGVLSRPHVLRALEALPDVDLINGYGPTENTTFSTTHRLRDGLPAGGASVPIGRPISGRPASVLEAAVAPARAPYPRRPRRRARPRARAAAGRVRRGALRGRPRRGARLPRPSGA